MKAATRKMKTENNKISMCGVASLQPGLQIVIRATPKKIENRSFTRIECEPLSTKSAFMKTPQFRTRKYLPLYGTALRSRCQYIFSRHEISKRLCLTRDHAQNLSALDMGAL